MIKKEENKILKIYGLIGKSFCSCAGGIVGFVLEGPFLAVLGVFAGFIVGHFIEKTFSNK